MKKDYTKKTSNTDWNKVDKLTNETIDYSDIPEVTEEFFKLAFIRTPTTKKMISLRVDQDLIDFFKHLDKHYQTKIHQVLRAYKTAYERVVHHI